MPDKRLAGAKFLGHTLTDWKHPWEEPSMGCPGAWYRTPYVDSLVFADGHTRYYRRRTRGGGRAQNPLFDAADWQVQRAILYLEAEEDRCADYVERVGAEHRIAELEKDPPAAAMPRRQAGRRGRL